MRSNNSKTSRAFWARGFAALCAALAVAAAGSASAAPTETVLHSFAGGRSDGANPFAGLIADPSGNLYGTTRGSLSSSSNSGTVFKLAPDGTETVLHSFTVFDGAFPQADLIADSNGNLYGATEDGGLPGNCIFGCGVVFKLSPNGTETVLHSFTFRDGALPQAGLIADSNGNLYGTTKDGGMLLEKDRAGFGGVVFKLSPPATAGGAWTETVLYSFCNQPAVSSCSDGLNPLAGLIADSNGNLYGSTSGGGGPGCLLAPTVGTDCGVVSKLSPPATAGGAWTETVLNSFTGSDGEFPAAGLIADGNGNLYGTTKLGGGSGKGVVFKLSPPATAGGAWTETVLYSFTGGSDGANPEAGLCAQFSRQCARQSFPDSNGNLYGTTSGGGGSGNGVVFKLSPPATAGGAWTETVLYSFCPMSGCSDGAQTVAGLIADSSGNLYGTTNSMAQQKLAARRITAWCSS